MTMPVTPVDVVEEPWARHVFWSLAGAGQARLAFAVILLGWSATETTGSATASVNIYDGTDSSGVILLPIRLASGESAEAWYGPGGIRFRNGVYINVASGAAQGALFYRHYR
jgi:hypothetical protein